MEEKKLLIIDVNALLYRAFHALPPLTTKKGEQTGAVYGFLLTLFRAIKDIQPAFVVACSDHPAPTFRHKKFKEYKAQRPETPKDLVSQIPKIKKILEKLNIPIFEKEGFEADDLIATIVNKVSQETLQNYVVSGDLDMLQLVSDKVKVYTLGKGVKETIVYDKEKVASRFGVAPVQLVDFKALVGDPSDNIPGVSGVGKKTAADLLQRFKNIETLYEKLQESKIKPKIKKALLAAKEQVFLSKELVKAKTDIPVVFDITKCKFGDFDKRKVEKALRELDFQTLIGRLPSLFPESSKNQQHLII